MDSDELEETVMSKETRTLKRLTVQDAEMTALAFENLMGNDVEPRKKFFELNGHKANICI